MAIDRFLWNVAADDVERTAAFYRSLFGMVVDLSSLGDAWV